MSKKETDNAPGRPSPSPEPSDVWLPRLVRLLDDQIADAQRLSALSRAQGELAAAGEVEGVVELLEERAPLVEAMQRRGGEFEPFAKNMGEMLRAVAPRYRELLVEKIARIEAMVAIINQQDDIDRVALERTRDRLAQEIAGVGRGKSALSAYGRERGDVSENSARYQDREG